jgi:ribonuclease HI
MLTIYTDGSSRGNPGPGGYGTVLIFGKHRKELSQGYKRTTNNRMELMAVIAGIEVLTKPGQQILVVSDSKYVVDTIEKNWIVKWVKTNFKGKKNKDLWLRFLEAAQHHQVKFKWVKGHAGHRENERCDVLAVQAAMGSHLIKDVGYEG